MLIVSIISIKNIQFNPKISLTKITVYFGDIIEIAIGGA